MVQVVWFKRDLRTADHRPLAEAVETGDPVTSLTCWSACIGR